MSCCHPFIDRKHQDGIDEDENVYNGSEDRRLLDQDMRRTHHETGSRFRNNSYPGTEPRYSTSSNVSTQLTTDSDDISNLWNRSVVKMAKSVIDISALVTQPSAGMNQYEKKEWIDRENYYKRKIDASTELPKILKSMRDKSDPKIPDVVQKSSSSRFKTSSFQSASSTSTSSTDLSSSTAVESTKRKEATDDSKKSRKKMRRYISNLKIEPIPPEEILLINYVSQKTLEAIKTGFRVKHEGDLVVPFTLYVP